MAANCAEPRGCLTDWRRTSGGAYSLPGSRNMPICTSGIGRALRPAMSFGQFGARSMHDI